MHKTHGRGGVFSVCDEETEKTKKQKIKQATAPPKQKTTAATTSNPLKWKNKALSNKNEGIMNPFTPTISYAWRVN